MVATFKADRTLIADKEFEKSRSEFEISPTKFS